MYVVCVLFACVQTLFFLCVRDCFVGLSVVCVSVVLM